MIRGLVLVVVCAGSIAANASFTSPPRYDGAGYSVLAISLMQGRGYREIDHPRSPPHAHFPPLYPMALSLVWSVTGVSFAAAHAFSFPCTVLAVILFWKWIGRSFPPTESFLMALALAVNWRWARDGASIQSEPLFLLLLAVAMKLCGDTQEDSTAKAQGRGEGQNPLRSSPLGALVRRCSRSGTLRFLLLGLILGAMTLTRHVGAVVILAVVGELAMRGRRREAMVTGLVATLVVLPWACWLVWVGRNTQVGLVPVRGVGNVLASNAWFYVQRLIDTLIGPVIEVFTVFRPGASGVATAVAALACVPIVGGWFRLLRDPERRLMGVVPLGMMALLLVWPFTEAGRFLVPMVPFVIVGAVEGSAAILRSSHLRSWAAGLVLAASLPYPLYAIATGRAAAARASQDSFDSACAWIAAHGEPPGPVLTRHPGEVFLLTGRTATAAPEGASPEDVARLIDQFGVAFLLVDDDRFARAPTSPLGRYANRFPASVREVFVSRTPPVVRVFQMGSMER